MWTELALILGAGTNVAPLRPTGGTRWPRSWPLKEAEPESRSGTEAAQGGWTQQHPRRLCLQCLCKVAFHCPPAPCILLLWSQSWPGASRMLHLASSPSSLCGEVNYSTQSPCYTQPRRFDDFPPLESVELKLISEPSSILHRLGNAGPSSSPG